jgi:hypothetical protein
MVWCGRAPSKVTNWLIPYDQAFGRNAAFALKNPAGQINPLPGTSVLLFTVNVYPYV